MINHFEDWEDALIVGQYKARGLDFLAAQLPRHTRDSIKSRAGQLGVRNKRPKDWSLTEENDFRACYPDFKKAKKKLVGRSFSALYERARVLGLARLKVWDDAADAILSCGTGVHTDREIAAILGRSVSSIRRRRRLLRSTSDVQKPVQILLEERQSHVPVVDDVIAEAKRRGVQLGKLTAALNCARIKPSKKRSNMSITAIAKVTEAFGGHLYAEWDD